MSWLSTLFGYSTVSNNISYIQRVRRIKLNKKIDVSGEEEISTEGEVKADVKSEPMFETGDEVTVIGMGAPAWKKLPDDTIEVYDMMPYIVGLSGIVVDSYYNPNNEGYKYILKGIPFKSAWFKEKYLVKKRKKYNHEFDRITDK